VASPRLCCAGEAELGNRETAEDVDGRMRVEREDTALGEGACRESILMCCCAQLSVRREEWLLDLLQRGARSQEVIIDLSEVIGCNYGSREIYIARLDI